MADIKASKQQLQRNRLIDLIPLDTPLSMQIELASSCNFHCRFCMHHDDKTVREKMKLGTMDLQTFGRVVEGMKAFPEKVGYVTLQSRGESLLNQHIVEMLKIIKEAQVVEKVGLYTNGTLLTEEISDGLIREGLDVLHVSINGINETQYLNITGTIVNIDDIIAKVNYFYNHKKDTYLYIKTMENDLSDSDRKQFFDVFSRISDEVFIERPVNAWQGANIDETMLKKDRYKMNGRKVMICPRLYFALVVHFDGTVVACDHDWSEQYVLGNICEKNLFDIWNGSRLNDLRLLHIRGKADEIDRCRTCIQRTECLEMDDIDAMLDS